MFAPASEETFDASLTGGTPGRTSIVGDGAAEGGGTEALLDDDVAEWAECVLATVAAPLEQAARTTRTTASPAVRMRRVIAVPFPPENAVVDDAMILRAAAERL